MAPSLSIGGRKLVLGYLLFVIVCATLDADCVVETPKGRIIGHRSNKQPDVCEFLGIPYAAAPLGSLRFAPPVPNGLTDTYIANNWVRFR